MEMDRISVIVPVYKVEKYLERCIRSIQNQTYQNLEILLIDDGSPDSCGDICDRYAKADERIHVLHKQNGGLSDARNAGIEVATGEYLAFADSDDWIDSRMYEVLHTTLKKYCADIAECSYRNIYADCVIEETTCTAEMVEGDPIFALEAMLDWNYFKPNAWNKLYKRNAIGEIRYPKGRIHEDEFTTYKYFYQAEKLVFIDFSLYNYDRRRTDSITGENFREASLDAFWAFQERMKFVHEKQLLNLQRKMNDIYCWKTLDLADKCCQHHVHGTKVNEFIREIRKDLTCLEKSDVDPWYLKRLQVLSKGIQVYDMEKGFSKAIGKIKRILK